MNNRFTVFPKSGLFTLLVLLLSVLLVACGGDTAEPTAAPAAEPAGDATDTTDDGATDTGNTAVSAEGVQTYTVITDESSAAYIVNEEFLAEALEKLGIQAGEQVIIGTTSGVSGEIQLNFDNPDPFVGAQFTVDMTGLETDQDRRDDWLRDNALETSRYPEATFVATSATGLPEEPVAGEEINFQLNGDLTVRETTIPVTFDVNATLIDNTISGRAVLDLSMTDLGITPPNFANTLTVADPFTIEVTLTARQQS